MAYKVLIPQDVAEAGKEFLRECGYEVMIGSGSSVEIMKKEVQDCDAILLRTAKCPREVLEAGKKLKVIGRHGVGVDNIDIEAANELGISITFTPLAISCSVAEHTIALMLALSKNLRICDMGIRRGDFEIRNRIKGTDLEGKTLGLIGLGKIGREVAKKAVFGFGMRVAAYDPYLSENMLPEGAEHVKDLDYLFRNSDFISLHIPATNETKNMIGFREFSMMKKTAFFLNVARGQIVDEAALIEALKTGKIAGAGLDVFVKEPPEPDNELFSMDNVALTPHNASLTVEAMDRMSLHAAQGIHEVLSGQKPSWPVNNPRLNS